MADIPERFVRLAADEILGEEATCTTGYYGASWRIDSEHAPDIARVALAPVLADLRRQVESMRGEAHDMYGESDEAFWRYVVSEFDRVLALVDGGGSDG